MPTGITCQFPEHHNSGGSGFPWGLVMSRRLAWWALVLFGVFYLLTDPGGAEQRTSRSQDRALRAGWRGPCGSAPPPGLAGSLGADNVRESRLRVDAVVVQLDEPCVVYVGVADAAGWRVVVHVNRAS
jgi:hypothetical protein